MRNQIVRLTILLGILISAGSLQLFADGPLPVPTGPNPPLHLTK
jgi:hypothetical protein